MEKTYYLTKDQFLAISAKWKTTKSHTASNHLIYNILRSKPSDLGFTKNEKHTQNKNPWYAYNQAKSDALWLIRTNLPSWSTYNPNEAFKAIFGIDIPDGLSDKLNGLMQK